MAKFLLCFQITEPKSLEFDSQLEHEEFFLFFLDFLEEHEPLSFGLAFFLDFLEEHEPLSFGLVIEKLTSMLQLRIELKTFRSVI